MPRLFKHLEIKRPTWEIDPLGNTFGAGGLFLTLSELHKFGLFYLNKGKWNGKQLLNAAWIEEKHKSHQTQNSMVICSGVENIIPTVPMANILSFPLYCLTQMPSYPLSQNAATEKN